MQIIVLLFKVYDSNINAPLQTTRASATTTTTIMTTTTNVPTTTTNVPSTTTAREYLRYRIYSYRSPTLDIVLNNGPLG